MPRACSEKFPQPLPRSSRENTTATGCSSLASQHMPSSSGSLRLAVNRFASTEPQSWAASPPLARTEGIIPSVQNVTSLPALGSSLMEKDHTTRVPRARAPDLRASKCVHSRALSIKAQPQADTCSHWHARSMCAGWRPGGDLSRAN